MACRFPVLIAAPAAPAQIWLVLPLGVPVASCGSNPDFVARRATPDG